MSTLSLTSWQPSNLDYFSEGRINATGLTTYWQAINNSFESWDKDPMKSKFQQATPKQNIPNRHRASMHREWQAPYDKYHWHASENKLQLPRPGQTHPYHKY